VRIVFLGTPRAAVASLEALVARGHEVVLVVTRADRPVGRSGRPAPPPVKSAATALGLAVHQPTRVKNRAFVEELSRRRPDVLVVVAYGRILTRRVLDVAPAGAINVHFSLLPKYRGAAPVQWALAHGEQTTGVTTMQIDEQLDAGDLLGQCTVSVLPGEHAPSLEARLAEKGAALLVDTLERLRAGELEPRSQDDAAATYAPLLTPADGEVDPSALTASEIGGRVRGFDPWPGVWLMRRGKRVRLLEAREAGQRRPGAEPGAVVEFADGALLVACRDGSLLRVTRVQPEGRRAMAARDAVNGRQLVPGDRLVRVAGPA
jgi:methionyl-tRNA formyltransferase